MELLFSVIECNKYKLQKALTVFAFLLLCISTHADNAKYIQMDNDGVIQTTSGTIYRLFQGERLSIDSTNTINIFSDKAFVHNISGLYNILDESNYKSYYDYDVESKISIRKDNDSLYVRIKHIDGFRECLLINQNRNKCFAKLTEKQLETFNSYSLNAIKCDSNTVIRIAPIGFFSFVVHWNNIKRVSENINSTRYTIYELTITKTSNKDTIRTYKRLRKEPYMERKDSFILYIVVCVTLVLGIAMLLCWKVISRKKKITVKKISELLEEVSLRNKINELEKERAMLMENLEKRKEEGKERMYSLKKQLEKYECRVKELKDENHVLKCDLDRSYEEKSELKSRLCKTDEQIMCLRKEIEDIMRRKK